MDKMVQEGGKGQAQKALGEMQKGGGSTDAAAPKSDSVSKDDLKEALEDQAKSQQGANVAKAAPKTSSAINDAAKGLGKETGSSVLPPDGQAAPGAPGGGGKRGPRRRISRVPKSTVLEVFEDEMKKLFG